ncbi:MAG: DUF6259 domain-containing protein [Bacteroidales bacterium]|nr:DUF6259 domain-containing protein [Bacteroidales bacterium]MEA4839411.1 DUF6259 domain-containing protein [Bacteroidales bacterium]
MINKCSIFILVYLACSTALWGKVKSTQVTETDSTVTIQNSKVSIEFSNSKTFDISKMILNGKNIISNKGDNNIPWILTYKGPQGENPVFYPSHGEYTGWKKVTKDGHTAIAFKWNIRLTYKDMVSVIMTVSIPDDSELIYWDILSGTPDGWLVCNTQFPCVTVTRPNDAKLITSAGWGAEYNLGDPQVYDSSYPSVTGSMQLLLLHNSEGSIYYATQDKEGCGKNLRTVVGDKSVTFLTDVITSEGWSNHTNKTFALPWSTVLGYSNLGWQDAATKWYRPFTYTTEWGGKTLASRNIPQWLLNTDVWIRAKGVNDTVRNAVNKAIDLYGKNTFVHWYFWHHYPYDTHYPDYFPAKKDFADMIAEVRKKGCHTVPYINGRLWDPASDSYVALNGASASCRKPDGMLYTEIYPTSKVLNTVTCPASELWQGIITDLVIKIQKELKTNGVYIDQIAAAAPQPCWATNHGHACGGGDFWHKSYRHLMDSIRTNYLEPGNILVSEENAECYIDLFDVLLTVNSPHNGCRIVPLFPMIYSDRLITSAYTYSPTDRVNRGDFLYQTMQCFLYGSQLGWVDPTLLMKEEAKKEAGFLKTLSTLRKEQHDVFVGGRYLKEIIPKGDNPAIDVPGFGKMNVVAGSEWISSKGRKVRYYVNMDNVDHEIVLPNYKKMVVKALQGIKISL